MNETTTDIILGSGWALLAITLVLLCAPLVNALPFGSERDYQVQQCVRLLNVTNASSICQQLLPGFDPNLQ